MTTNRWKKVENEAGYPYYVDMNTKKEQKDHPLFLNFMESLKEYNGIKYSAYRIAFKIFSLQKQLRVPPLRISSGVFARHQLSLSESSLSLDTVELESVLADIYFAAEKEGLYCGDVDLAVDLLINLLLNVFDRERKEPIRVLAAKTLLILLSEESVYDKWVALANSCADHNGCVSSRRLASLLTYVNALPEYLDHTSVALETDVDTCFEKSAGMLGISARSVADWAVNTCVSTRWLSVVQRVMDSRNCSKANASCKGCSQPLIQVLKFKCAKCTELYFCEKCYLYDKDMASVTGHKKSHLVQEIIDGEVQPSECLSFMKGMKRFFFCTKTKKKKTSKKCVKKIERENTDRRRKDGKPAIFTSTIGKASGNNANNPTNVLQDIISQLETQNKALKDLSVQLQNVVKNDEDRLRIKVDLHWNQISTQINRLKILKDNLTTNTENTQPDTKTDKTERPQAFDLFSPIPIEDIKQSKVMENLKPPRVLSLDSGNFSVVSKQGESQNLLTMSGDALKPVVVHATSDSISTVSMNDISSWYNETQPDKVTKVKPRPNQSVLATEQRYAADLRCVEEGNDKMKELNADLDTVLDRLHQILNNNFAVDDSCFDNTQLRETANEMEGLLGTLIRGVEQRATLNATKGLV